MLGIIFVPPLILFDWKWRQKPTARNSMNIPEVHLNRIPEIHLSGLRNCSFEITVIFSPLFIISEVLCAAEWTSLRAYLWLMWGTNSSGDNLIPSTGKSSTCSCTKSLACIDGGGQSMKCSKWFSYDVEVDILGLATNVRFVRDIFYYLLSSTSSRCALFVHSNNCKIMHLISSSIPF